ncbi:MAG: hypothetical protein JW751_21940 [Polyangiaceae bacterium]|nr:hypothetical protein [Polyangiaceae bacterium]
MAVAMLPHAPHPFGLATRRGLARKARWVLLVGILAAPAGCRSRDDETPADAGVVRRATPPGFRPVTADGWSLAIPESYTIRASHEGTEDMTWLVYAGDLAAPGSPSVLFARYAKPVTFPSRVFGLTVMNQLEREPSKRLLSQRQYEVGGLTVTDLEVEVAEKERPRHQWRRLFVHDAVAYLLTVSIGKDEAGRMRPTADQIVGSLGRDAR